MGTSQSQHSEPNVDNISIKRQNQESHVQQPMEETADKYEAMEKKERVQFPHNYEAILKEADSPVDMSSKDKLLSQLHAGVFLNQKRKKYWVDNKSNKNCFMLEVYHYVAELLKVCWLELQAKFDAAKLSPGTLYGVTFVVMLRDEAFGWEVPVNFRLTLPNGEKVERKEILMNKPTGKWIEIPVGEFTTSPENVGELEIYIYEYDTGAWKRGLIVKGVAIQPKN
ncbi:hypothetical protein PTKIN_Ptkin01aG0081100 [Pterospermum kingtungense]